MLNLRLLQPLDVHQLGEGERIEAGITDHVLFKILRLGEEGDRRGSLCHAHGSAGGDGRGGETGTTKEGTADRGRASADGEGGNKSRGDHSFGGVSGVLEG